jgi:hypothetical protein
MQQQRSEANSAFPEFNPGAFATATGTSEETEIDQRTLATLDIGLFRCLSNLGTSRQRICSALFLSYAEYDYISKHQETLWGN